jgi:transposase-like protein
MPKRRNYPPEFKHEAVELTRMEEVTISQIATALISPDVLFSS